MDLLIKRRKTKPGADSTGGELFIDHDEHGMVFECYTLEDQVRADPNPDTPQNEGKVYGKTAIPGGGNRYRITLVDSHHFGPDTMHLNDVPGYTDVHMHGGNKPEDTLGCILLGDSLINLPSGERIAGGTSRPAVNRLKAKVKAAIAAGEEVWLTVEDA